ncbi:MAG: HDOD domain-containing protein [bacterium]|nr:HDOD domain-containing protein [bacterium]
MVTCPWCAHDMQVANPGVFCACPNCLNPCYRPDEGAGDTACLPGAEDIRDYAPRGSAVGDVMARLYGAIRELPVLPEGPQRVISMVHDPLSTMDEIAAVVNEDTGLAIRVLRIANSAIYTGLEEVKDTQMACARLGMKVIANTMWAVLGNGVYRHHGDGEQDWVPELWRHAVAAAHSAEWVAASLRQGGADSRFVAGLTHDIGKAVLLQIISEQRTQPIHRLAQSEENVQKIVAKYHALAGLHVIQHMGLPTHLRAAAYFHHDFASVPFEEERVPVLTVALADWLAHVAEDDLDAPAGGTTPLHEHPAAEGLGLSEIDARRLLAQARSEMGNVLDAFMAA